MWMGAEVGTVSPLNAAATLAFLVALILPLFLHEAQCWVTQVQS